MADYPTLTTSRARTETMNAFMRGVYQWMTLGLGVTAALSYLVVSNESFLVYLSQHMFVFYGLMFAELGLVIALSAGIRKFSAGTATGMFLVYSALNGVTLGPILYVYGQAAVFKAFLTTAGMFGAMSIYGMTTKKDLTSWGSFLMMGLIGIIIAMVVNMFLGSSTMDFVISGLGVVVFLGLTAYDTQKLKVMGEVAPEGADAATAVRKMTILGALTLYLDFLNLFLMLLRFFGGGGND